MPTCNVTPLRSGLNVIKLLNIWKRYTDRKVVSKSNCPHLKSIKGVLHAQGTSRPPPLGGHCPPLKNVCPPWLSQGGALAPPWDRNPWKCVCETLRITFSKKISPEAGLFFSPATGFLSGTNHMVYKALEKNCVFQTLRHYKNYIFEILSLQQATLLDSFQN